METLKDSFFSLMLLNLIIKDILDFLTATVVYALGALRTKHLKASFIDLFNQIIKIRRMSIFSFKIFREYGEYKTLCQLYSASTDCSTKETIDSFFRRAL